MQREILFRGCTVQYSDDDFEYKGEWIFGYLHIDHFNRHYIIECKKSGRIYPGTQVISETVGQLTGLSDKNGKKIFENDLLGCWVKDINKKDKQLLCRVAFNNGSFVIDISRYLNGKLFTDLKTYLEDYVVVGNIHDNADLLPQNEKQL